MIFFFIILQFVKEILEKEQGNFELIYLVKPFELKKNTKIYFSFSFVVLL